MSKEISCLKDIQNNTSEFNIKFHMGEIIGLAMMSTFLVPKNMKMVSELTNMKIEPSDMKTVLISHAFEPLIDRYLASDCGEDEEEGEEDE